MERCFEDVRVLSQSGKDGEEGLRVPCSYKSQTEDCYVRKQSKTAGSIFPPSPITTKTSESLRIGELKSNTMQDLA